MQTRLKLLVLSLLAISCKNPKTVHNQGFDATILNSEEVVRSPIAGRPTNAFVNPADFAIPANLNVSTEEELRNDLAADVDFFNKTPDDDVSCPPWDNLRPQISGNRLEIAADINYLPCVKPNQNTRYLSLNAKFLVVIICKESDFSSLQGLTIKEVMQRATNEDLCETEGNTLGVFMNMKLGGAVEYTENNAKKTVNITSIIADQTDNGQICIQHKRGNYYYHSPCVHNSKTTYSDSSIASLVEYASETGVAGSYSAPFYQSGMFNFHYGNWKGQVTNKGDQLPPAFTATSSQNQSISGELRFRPTSLALSNSEGALLKFRRPRIKLR